MNDKEKEKFKIQIKAMSTDILIKNTRKAYCYCHFNDDKDKKELFKMLSDEAWNRSLPIKHIVYDIEIPVSDMSMWEVKYYIKDILDIG